MPFSSYLYVYQNRIFEVSFRIKRRSAAHME